MPYDSHHRLIILGSGPAGYTAAIYAARAGLSPVLITGMAQGGQLMTTTDVDNWPADVAGVQGPALMTRFEEHAKRFNTSLIFDEVLEVELTKKPFMLKGSNASYHADALIIATGANAQYLGLPSEAAYLGKGVSACATCDGFFFKNQNVAVIGGGNTAVEEALYLNQLASHVTVVHRRDRFRAEKMMSDTLFERERAGTVSIIWNATLDEVLGDGTQVTGMRLNMLKENHKRDIPLAGIFIAIGHKPNTAIFEGQLAMTHGYLQTRSGHAGMATETSIAGVFAAGDVQDAIYRQAVTSAASGCMAALDAKHYLENL